METPTENQETKLTIVKVDPPEIVDPAEFGMVIKQFQLIEDAFTPTMSESKVLFKIYDTVINSEMSPELAEEAKKARIATGKAIKKIEDTHKTQKAYFWQGGKCVDAIRKSRVKPLEQIKAGFKEIEDYYHIQELERIEKVRVKRTKELSKFTGEIPEDIGAMRMQIYDNYLLGAKATYEAKIEAEKKAKQERIEAEKAEKEKQERLKKENKKLRLEAKEKERLAKIELDKREKADAERIKKEGIEQKKRDDIEAEKDRLAKIKADRNEDLRPYITFIRDYDKMLKLPEVEYQKEFTDIKKAAADQREYLRKEQIKQVSIEAKNQQEQDAILEKERKEKQDLQDQLQAKNEADTLREKQEQDRIEVELNKGDAAKIKDLVKDLETLKTKYVFKSKKNEIKYLGVINLLSKVISYILD